MTGAAVLYFAYGSNMLWRRLRAPDRAPGAVKLAVGGLAGHRLTFDKIGRHDNSGKCDAEHSGCESDAVHGVVYRVPMNEVAMLDRVEGLGHGYARRPVRVEATGKVIECMTYLATAKDPMLRPYRWYRDLVVAGALEHALPTRYLETLRDVPVIEDPDSRRHAENAALLAER